MLAIKIKFFMASFRPVKSKKRSKRYDKVTHKVKIELFKRVLCDHKEIKESADDLDINYSTAKTLMRKYHRCGNDMNFQVLQGISRWYQEYGKNGKPRCGYRVLEDSDQKLKVEEVSREEQVDATGQGSRFQVNLVGRLPRIQVFQQVLFQN